MKEKYTIKNLNEVSTLISEAKELDQIIDILNQSDNMVKLMIITAFYNGHNYKNVATILNRLGNRDFIILFCKHIGLDFNDIMDDLETYKVVIGFNNADDNQKEGFLKALITLLYNLQNKELLLQKEKEYYELVIANSPRFFKIINTISSGVNPYDLVTEILLHEDISVEEKQKLFDEVLSKNITFLSLNYDEIFIKCNDLSFQIVGFFNCLSPNFLKTIMSDEYLNDANETEIEEFLTEFRTDIEKILQCNANNERELKKAILKIETAGQNNSRAYQVLQESSIYMEYRNKVTIPPNINEKILQDILNGDYSIEFETLYIEFAMSQLMIDNYDLLVNVLLTGENDEKFGRLLATTLLVGLSEKIKKEYNLEYDLEFSTEKMQNNLYGYYNDVDKILYVNRLFIYGHDDYKAGFASGVNTLYHELKHAKQFQHELREKKWNYDTIMQSMDKYLSTRATIEHYYQDNYANITYETDAVAEAFVNTMAFFEKYPDIQEIVRQQLENKASAFKKRTRVSNVLDFFNEYNTVFELFIRGINRSAKIEDDVKHREGAGVEKINSMLAAFPSLQLVIWFDEESKEYKLHDEEYFINRLNEFKQMEQTEEVAEAIYCIENILYDLKVQDYIRNVDFTEIIIADSQEIREKLIAELEEKITNELGMPPQRR